MKLKKVFKKTAENYHSIKQTRGEPSGRSTELYSRAQIIRETKVTKVLFLYRDIQSVF